MAIEAVSRAAITTETAPKKIEPKEKDESESSTRESSAEASSSASEDGGDSGKKQIAVA